MAEVEIASMMLLLMPRARELPPLMENILLVEGQYRSLEDLLSSAEEGSERSFVLSDRGDFSALGLNGDTLRSTVVRSRAKFVKQRSKFNKGSNVNNKESNEDNNDDEEEEESDEERSASPTSEDYDTNLEDDVGEDTIRSLCHCACLFNSHTRGIHMGSLCQSESWHTIMMNYVQHVFG